jgi:DNA repair exonuclease SbcCD ATPase subunit
MEQIGQANTEQDLEQRKAQARQAFTFDNNVASNDFQTLQRLAQGTGIPMDSQGIGESHSAQVRCLQTLAVFEDDFRELEGQTKKLDGTIDGLESELPEVLTDTDGFRHLQDLQANLRDEIERMERARTELEEVLKEYAQFESEIENGNLDDADIADKRAELDERSTKASRRLGDSVHAISTTSIEIGTSCERLGDAASEYDTSSQTCKEIGAEAKKTSLLASEQAMSCAQHVQESPGYVSAGLQSPGVDIDVDIEHELTAEQKLEIERKVEIQHPGISF